MTYRHILMGRIKGFEPSDDGATIRCVNHFTIFAMAGDARIELALTVLETGVLPLYDSPMLLINYNKLFIILQVFYKKIISNCIKIQLLIISLCFQMFDNELYLFD